MYLYQGKDLGKNVYVKVNKIKKKGVNKLSEDRVIYENEMERPIDRHERLLDIEAEILKLKKRVKKLEKSQTYYPMTEEELLREKVGGTD